MHYKKIVIFILLIFQIAPVSASDDSSLITVVIMVKDEAPVICETLQPLIDGGIKNFLVYDTGSTDGTQDLAHNLFKKHNLCQAYILEEPFVDFATSRNKAIEHAERLFPETTFILMVDAEWYMSGVKELLTFCKQEKNSTTNSYLVTYYAFAPHSKKPFLSTGKEWLFRPFKNVKFVGVVHEGLNIVTIQSVPKNCFFEHRVSEYGGQKSAERFKKDKKALLKTHAENPSDMHALYYLALTCSWLGDWQEAYDFYKKHDVLQGGKNFITELRLGDIVQHIPSECTKSSDICSPAIEHYLQAYCLRPHRAEPLVRIAQYYLAKNIMPLAFLFSLEATKIPYPADDAHFIAIEDEVYNVTRYDVLGISAWYMGKYELGEWAVRQALANCPDAAHLQKNLQFYTERLTSDAQKIVR